MLLLVCISITKNLKRCFSIGISKNQTTLYQCWFDLHIIHYHVMCIVIVTSVRITRIDIHIMYNDAQTFGQVIFHPPILGSRTQGGDIPNMKCSKIGLKLSFFMVKQHLYDSGETISNIFWQSLRDLSKMLEISQFIS